MGGGMNWSNICGGIVGFAKIHACVAEDCYVNKNVTNKSQLLPDRIYIHTPAVGEKRTIYLHPSISIDEVGERILRSLSTQERIISAWSSLLSCLPSLNKENKYPSKLVASIDQSSLCEDFLTPHKKQKRVVKSLSDNQLSFDFNDTVLDIKYSGNKLLKLIEDTVYIFKKLN